MTRCTDDVEIGTIADALDAVKQLQDSLGVYLDVENARPGNRTVRYLAERLADGDYTVAQVEEALTTLAMFGEQRRPRRTAANECCGFTGQSVKPVKGSERAQTSPQLAA